MLNKVTGIFDKKKDDDAPNNISENDSLKKDEKKGLFQEMSNFANTVVDKGKEHANQLKDAVSEKLSVWDNALKDAITAKKLQFNIWIRKKIQERVIMLIEKARPIAKEKLKDPDMCNFVKTAVDDTIDNTWPYIIEEVKYHMNVAISEPYVEVKRTKVFFLCAPFYCIKKTFLYAMMPYDRTFWKQTRTFWFWFFSLISSVPVYGVQPLWYLFVFLCIDKSDQFQLVQYILKFKGMQFVSQGIMLSVIGYFQYYSCTTMNKNPNDIGVDCYNKGPGAKSSNSQVYYDLITFCLQVLLIWGAFFLLPCSKQKGHPRFKYDDTPPEDLDDETQVCQCNAKRGGMLFSFMIYDIFTFIVAIVLCIITINYMDVNNFDDAQQFVYFAQVIYGILSFPFLIFVVPPIQQIITKSRPTAYDQFGNTVPKRSRIKINYEKRDANIDSTFDVDVTEIFDS